MQNSFFESLIKDIPLYLYNTETKRKEQVLPKNGKEIKLYTCGPTVYDYAHIGNFRTFIAEDILRRTLQFFHMSVVQVLNITDVDDKTIRGSIQANCSLKEYTDLYAQAFFEDLKMLNIQKAEYYPRATEYIPQMIEMIQSLLDAKMAYKGQDGSIYFAINTFDRYGVLSKFAQEAKKGSCLEHRIHTDEYTKDHISDFALWKSYDPERDKAVFWESPFGKGRPGWHIECSAMAQSLLGKTIDIHAGGVDLIFPHHENEIAQSEGCSGCLFSHMWFHVEHLLVDNRKMSKSLGNFYTLRDIIQKGYSGRALRYLLLSSHYRTQLNFTFHALDAAHQACLRLQSFTNRINEYTAFTKNTTEVKKYIEDSYRAFAQALADDINISEALAAVFDAVRILNFLCDKEQVTQEDVVLIKAFIKQINSVLGVIQTEEEVIPEEILQLVNERNNARKNKDWKKADQLRDEILAKGYAMEDTPKGIRIRPLTKSEGS